MRVPQYNPAHRYGFNMTPMIDVVFLLVIFFLVSSHLAKQDSQMELRLPVAQSGDDDTHQDIPRVTVNVKPDGSIWVQGKIVAESDLTPLFKAALEAEKHQTIEVRIRGSRLATWSSFEPIMLACTRAGVWNVTYAVYRDEVQ